MDVPLVIGEETPPGGRMCQEKGVGLSLGIKVSVRLA